MDGIGELKEELIRRGMGKRFVAGYLMCWLCLLSYAGVAWGGDIYFYKDKQGVYHFTDLPDSPRYKLFFPYYSFGDKAKIRSLVRRYSHKYRVDYALALAVLEVESGYDPTATSSAGAQGLMQIMPSTQMELNLYSPYDPEENIEAGIRYLSRLIHRYRNIKLAIAAYNAGPGAVDKYGGIPPYRETKMYVKKVLKRYREIRHNLMVEK